MLQLKITIPPPPSFKIFSSLSFILYDVRSIFCQFCRFHRFTRCFSHLNSPVFLIEIEFLLFYFLLFILKKKACNNRVVVIYPFFSSMNEYLFNCRAAEISFFPFCISFLYFVSGPKN